jgi:hypothetical protein
MKRPPLGRKPQPLMRPFPKPGSKVKPMRPRPQSASKVDAHVQQSDAGKQATAPVVQPAAAVKDAALRNNVSEAVEVPADAPAVDKDVMVVATDQSAELIDVIAEDLPHDPTNGSDCGPSQNNKVSVPELELAEADSEGQSAQAPADQTDIQLADVQPAPATAEAPADDSTAAAAVANNDRRNGDETDVRMWEIQTILDHAGKRLLEKCELVTEYVRHAETKATLYDKLVAKPRAGRPLSGITRAARELAVPGKTEGARKKFIERAINIATSIWPQTKAAARAARLDNSISALLEIADLQSPEEQLTKIAEIKARRAAPRRKRDKANPTPISRDAGQPTRVVPDVVSGPADLALTADEQALFAQLRTAWTDDGVLQRADWQKASTRLRHRIAIDFLGLSHTSPGDTEGQVLPSSEAPSAPEQPN